MFKSVLQVRGVHSSCEPKNTMRGSTIVDITPNSTIEENLNVLTNHDHPVVLFDGHGPEVGAQEAALALYYANMENSLQMMYLRSEDVRQVSWKEKIFLSTA